MHRAKKRKLDDGDDCYAGRTAAACTECFRKEGEIKQLKQDLNRMQDSYVPKTLYEETRRKLELERKEKDDALTRLSALASSKLRDNNPNITDLSDQNRPTKIGEKFSELYDNEWTDAYDVLEKTMTEQEVIKTLLNILLDVFSKCKEFSTTNYFERLQQSIEFPVRDTQNTDYEVKQCLPDQLTQQVKEFRKLRAPMMLSNVAKCIEREVTIPRSDTDAMVKYFNRCVEICWLAVVQDPPLFINANVGEKFDTTLFRDFTSRGPYVEFLVWPALHLHSDGPLLTKGVAQGSKTPIQGSKTPVQGSKSPVQGSKTPVQGSKTPVQGSKTPVQGSKTPVPSIPPVHKRHLIGQYGDPTSSKDDNNLGSTRRTNKVLNKRKTTRKQPYTGRLSKSFNAKASTSKTTKPST